MTSGPSGHNKAQFATLLLAWYEVNKRELPWRSDKPVPYAVWISEIMLQQTTVPAVVGYYQRWLTRFPDVESLADASIDDVLKAWAGLGYYSRARNLHKAAKVIVEQHGGRLPSSVSELIMLPGVGRYTAGAIASIAYGMREAVVDANVKRVLSRVYGLKADQGDGKSLEMCLWAIADGLVPECDPSGYNQALMDLGSSVCTSTAPKCNDCPVSSLCVAYRSGDPEQYPEPVRSKSWNVVDHACVALIHDGRVLVAQRPIDSTLWPGLWELPRRVVLVGESEASIAKSLAEELGLEHLEELNKFTSLRHVVTNNKITLACYMLNIHAQIGLVPSGYSSSSWVTFEESRKLAFSAPQKRLIGKLSEAGLI